jgi:two-component system response regulator HydG
MRKLRALVVDDVLDMAQTIANELEGAGFETDVAASGSVALERFARDPVDVVVTDLRMKSVDGLDVLGGIKRADPTVPVIIMTAFGAVETAVEAMRRGAFYYVTKPFELETLRSLVERACRERALSRENVELRRTLRANAAAQRLLGQSAPMRQLRALIERVAGANSSVLISGETGTGKELVALAIHADSPRADKPFVAVNCAALPEPLLESELFGHARGAFTGASQSRRGLFVEADDGTLLLDEIGDLPLALQGSSCARCSRARFARWGASRAGR